MFNKSLAVTVPIIMVNKHSYWSLSLAGKMQFTFPFPHVLSRILFENTFTLKFHCAISGWFILRQ
jgi:hypothetical protein